MKSELIWSPDAENELTTLWLNPLLRHLVTAAAHRIDERLERNAADEGESRAGNVRIAFEPPLGVLFNVNEQANRVTVLHVWAFET